MKKIFIFLLSCSLYAENETHIKDIGLVPYTQITVGPLPLAFPGIGVGIRNPGNRVGFDASMNMNFFSANADTSVLLNMSRKTRSNKYCGFGVSGWKLFHETAYRLDDHFHSKQLSPKFSFGKNKLNRNDDLRFYEINLELCKHTDSDYYIPVFSMKWGFGF